MDLEILRKNIDEIDDEIARLFVERMIVVGNIKKVKKESAVSVYDPDRENKIKQRLSKNAPYEFGIYLEQLYEKIFELSKKYQNEPDCGR